MDAWGWLLLVLGVLLKVSLSSAEPLKLASFNIKWLDERKVNDPTILGVIVKVLGRYDLILIEELRGKPDDVITKLVTALNKHTTSLYSFKLSPPLGRTTYKEEYVYIYRMSVVEVRAIEHYSDPGDKFEREPFIMQVHLPHHTLKDFIFIGIHTKPDHTVAEVAQLETVYEYAVKKYGVEDVLLAGDMNAGCHYMSNAQVLSSPLHGSKFTWLISNSVDTTVSTHTTCAYDRFVIAGDKIKSAVVPGSAKPFYFQQEFGLTFEQAWSVSDHFPIEMQIA